MGPPTVQARGTRRGAAVLGVLAVLALIGVAGCGSSGSSGSSANPAGVVPASAPIYVGAVVRPSGVLQTDARSAAERLTHQRDPYARLVSLLQSPGSPALDYEHDVAPWLGPSAGLFVTSLGNSSTIEALLKDALGAASSSASSSKPAAWPFGAGAQGAIVLDTSDLGKAESFVSQQASRAGAHASSYRGVSYHVSAAGDAFAIVQKLVVLGSEAAVRAVIDTAEGGPSLEADETYSHLQAVAPTDAVAHVFADPQRAAQATGPKARIAGAGDASGLLSALSGQDPLNVSVIPSASSLALDADVASPSGSSGTGASSGGLVSALAGGSQAFDALPGDSWLAAGLGDTGGAGGVLNGAQRLLTAVGSLTGAGAGSSGGGSSSSESGGSQGITVKGVLDGVLAPLRALAGSGTQTRRSFERWAGAAGVFASGASILQLKGGVVIDSKDPAASRAAVAQVSSALQQAGDSATPITVPGTDAAAEATVSGLPVTLVIANGRAADGQTKFVVGLSTTSVQDALAPSSTLAGSSAAAGAQSALGEGIQPSLAVTVSSALSLLEGLGLNEDADIAPLIPYLRSSTALSGGGKSLGGGIERLRLVLGLQAAAG